MEPFAQIAVGASRPVRVSFMPKRFKVMGKLSKEGERLFKAFVEKTKNHLIACVRANKDRFSDSERFIARYHDAVSGVLKQGAQKLRAFHEAHNELCTATAILDDKSEPKVTQLQYEPRIDSCGKRFDFRVALSEGPIRYIEVKTIHPTTQDDWKKYQAALNNQRFPKDTYLILENEWLGGELYHNAYASRTKMLDYALDLEEKIEACLINVSEKLTFLTLFTNGFHWHLDELEDFIFFYLNGVHFPGDPFANMEEFVVKEKKIIFRKSIDHFAFFRRPKTEMKPNKVVWSVTSPNMPY